METIHGEGLGGVLGSWRRSRKVAIEEGALFDVTSAARAAGITIPVAFTAGVWLEHVAQPPEASDWLPMGWFGDILRALACELRYQARQHQPEREFLLWVDVPTGAGSDERILVKGVVELGDDMRPVLTISALGGKASSLRLRHQDAANE